MTLLQILVQALVNGLLIGCLYAMISIGLTLIWGTMEIINFAHGEFLMMGLYLAFWLFTLFAIDPLYSLPIVVLVFFGAGVLFYKFVLKLLVHRSLFPQVLATFGLGLIFQALALFFWSPNYRLVRGNILKGNFQIAGIWIGIPELVTSSFCVTAMVVLFYFLNQTRTGRAIRATTLNKEAAALVGIDIERIYILVVALGISLVGFAGGLLANFYYIYPRVGGNFAALAYVVVCIGGFGSTTGALMGGLLLGVVTSIAGIINPAFKYAAVFLVYLIVVLIKPTGLKGW